MRTFGTALAVLSVVALVAAEVYFEEGFKDDSWQKTWVQSEHKGVEYGKFEQTAGKFFNDAEADKGLQTSQDARFYALSTKFKPFSNKDDTLVIQFSVKHEQNIDCGGGYLKVFDCSVDQKDLHGDTPYLVMFGPDICGPGTKKVHVIFSYKGKNHLINKDIRCKPDDWDDEMDGEWEPPMIDNPEYKGEWKPKQIDNPNYKGVWVHPEIDNPEYVEDKNLYLRDEICGVGLDLWQVKSGTIFDNFLITNDVEAASKAAATFKETQEGEKKVKEAQEAEERKKAEEEAKAAEDAKDDEDLDDEDDEDSHAGQATELDEEEGHDEL